MSKRSPEPGDRAAAQCRSPTGDDIPRRQRAHLRLKVLQILL